MLSSLLKVRRKGGRLFFYYQIRNKTAGLLLKNRGKEPRLVSYYCPIFGFYQSFSLGVFQKLENAKPVVLGLSNFWTAPILLVWEKKLPYYG